MGTRTPQHSWHRRLAIGGATLLVVLAGCGIVGVISNTSLRTETYTYTSPRVPPAFDGFRVVQVSDLHEYRFGERQARLARAIERARPDLIVFTGDYVGTLLNRVDGTPRTTAQVAPVREIASRLSTRVPSCYIYGNWDMSIVHGGPPNRTDDLSRALESGPMRELGFALPIRREGQTLWLANWYTPSWDTTAAFEADVARELRSTQTWVPRARQAQRLRDARAFQMGADPNRDLVIAVTHRTLDDADGIVVPEYPPRQTEESTPTPVVYDLNLSGHAHGGQWRIPFLGGVISPDTAKLFPGDRLLSGMHTDEQGRTYVISAGLGAGGPVPWLRFRWGIRPEVTVTVLRSEQPHE